MHLFTSIIEKFSQKGEKSSWTHIIISESDALTIKPANKKSFRVRGRLNEVEIEGVAVMPMGGGEFILPINATIRKKLKLNIGDEVIVNIEEDKNFEIKMPEDLQDLLEMEGLLENFLAQAKSHQNYFIKYIDSAKTTETRVKRLNMTLDAMQRGMDYGGMIRSIK
jgi:bifunctional DNA-binding transcriptional regulator/antitoxin component of YhaV-PrlF toxin-antitoxin module